MKNSVFLVFTLFVFTGFVALYGYARSELNPTVVLESRLEHAEAARSEAELKAQLAAAQLADYQQHVATLLPGAIKKSETPEQAYPLRQLASVVGNEDRLQIERASGLMEKAKLAFREEAFEKAERNFKELIENFPESIHVVEAHFLLAETQFQLREYEQSLGTIERMIDLFPENELTGFALLRLGRIFELQDRLEDAADVYRSVISNFKQAEITAQAQTSLKAVAL